MTLSEPWPAEARPGVAPLHRALSGIAVVDLAVLSPGHLLGATRNRRAFCVLKLIINKREDRSMRAFFMASAAAATLTVGLAGAAFAACEEDFQALQATDTAGGGTASAAASGAATGQTDAATGTTTASGNAGATVETTTTTAAGGGATTGAAGSDAGAATAAGAGQTAAAGATAGDAPDTEG